jgi:hypothetical protein
MELLNEKHINLLHDWLLSNGLDYEELRTDLLDHVCCMIESRMSRGEPFNLAFKNVSSEFDHHELKNTQENTLYLLTLKQMKMKKATGILGIITSAVIITGVSFKLMHWPYASILLILGLASVSIIIMPLMTVIELKNATGVQQKAATIIGFLAAILLSLATMFKIFHWPGFYYLYYSGFTALVLVFIPLYTLRKYRQAENKIMSLSLSLLIFAGILLFWGLYPA